MNVGFHAPTQHGVLPTVKYLQSINCDSAQIWLGNPKGYHSQVLSVNYETKEYIQDTGFFLISHSPYIINFARCSPKDSPSTLRYIRDLHNITKLGGFGSVVHMGFNVKELNQTLEDACRTFTKNLEIVLESAPKESTIILENMAGKGTSMCCEIDEWSKFWNDCVGEDLKKRIKWCVDTAHLFATGEYNLSKRSESLRFYRDFDNLIDWESICCFHFNGSSAPFGSKRDLHADITPEKSGVIETKGLRKLARIAFATGKPLIMETPCNESDVTSQINLIRSWEITK